MGESQPQKEKCFVKPFQTGTFEGENKVLGNGIVYSWVKLDNEGNPLSMGVNLQNPPLKDFQNGKS